jgi:murein DD-endopeptidase MepM/ murein hydrolase activator NlpD
MKIIVVFFIIILFILSFYLWHENQQLKIENISLKEDLKHINFIISSIQNTLPEVESNENQSNSLSQILSRYLAANSNEEEKQVLTSEQLQTQQIPNQIPLLEEYAVSQKFSEMHQGIDLAAELGSQVVAAGLGAVVSVHFHPLLGNVVEIDHLNGYQTRYAHLVTAIVESGQLIKQGETIGFVGNTGRSSAPHLHFEISKDGEKINPLSLIRMK